MTPAASRRTLLWLLPLFVACAPHSSGGDTSGGPDASTGSCSSPGTTRCAGDEYQTCQDGAWHTDETCSAGQTCYSGHGCAECDPSHVQVCVGNDVYTCTGGVLGGMVEDCGAQTCSGGSCGGAPDDCAEATQVIYVVDRDRNFLSFDPRHDANTFHLIGQLNCPAGAPYPVLFEPQASPFSMSVDRTGRAWVLYTSGEIFLVSTTDASCTPSGFVKGSQGFELFGMAFVSESPGSDAETLFIAGGAASLALPTSNGDGDLGSVNPSSYATAKLGHITAQSGQRSPDLAGTGNAELWGYFPATGLFARSAVAQLDKTTGMRVHTYDVPAESGLVDAWAFAHYGGRYYIFVTAGANRVLRLDPMGNGGLGKVDVVIPDSPYQVVGAGVSTCAPVVVQ